MIGAARARRPTKYRNQRVFEPTIGVWFDSKAEHRRWQELSFQQIAGTITQLEVHPRYTILVNDQRIGVYEADFSYFDTQLQQRVVEDVKGHRTALFVWKKKLMQACHGIDVVEIKAKDVPR